ncbi:MAG: NYN domain-containing protein [Eubacteriales bacterium]
MDYEHWYIALDKNFHTKPDIQAFTDEVKKNRHIVSYTFFGDFSNSSLQNEMHKIRGFTNDIVETKNGGGYFKKDFTDFIMLDKIYQTAYSNKNVDTYVIFTGDSHFTSVVLFLKNVCRKNVVVYGVKNAFSGQLMTAASSFREIEPDELAPLCRLIVESIRALEAESRDARPTFMKTIDAVAAKSGADKPQVRRAMDQLFDKGCISQFVRKIGPNEVKLLKVDYKLCEQLGYYN